MKNTNKPIVFETVEEFKQYVNDTNNIIFINPFILEEMLLRIIKKNHVAHKLVKKCGNGYNQTVVYINEIEECENHTFAKEQEIFHKLTGYYYSEITADRLRADGYITAAEYKQIR